MHSNEEIKCKIISLAESAWAEVKFDLDFKIEPSHFFRLKFDNDKFETTKLSNSLYKYFTSGC